MPPLVKRSRSQPASNALSPMSARQAMPAIRDVDTGAVVTLARQKDEAHQIAERVDQRHDLGGQSATRLAYGLIFESPFCAGAMLVDPDEVASMRTYSKSGSSDRALKIRSQTPFCAQRQKRV